MSYTHQPTVLLGIGNPNEWMISDGLKATYVILGGLSMIATLFVAMTIFTSKKLSAHPSPLIGYICICEALNAFHTILWASNVSDVIDYFSLDVLFLKSTTM